MWLFWSRATLSSHAAPVGCVSLWGHVALAVVHLSAFINSYIPIRPIRTVVFIHSSYCDYLCRVDIVDEIVTVVIQQCTFLELVQRQIQFTLNFTINFRVK